MADWFDEQGVPQGGAIANGYVAGGGGAALGAAFGGSGSVTGGGMKVPAPGLADRLYSGEATHQMQGGPPPAGAAGGTRQVTDAAVQSILQSYPATNDGMRAAMVEIDRTFGPGVIKLLDHPHRLDKLVMPDGRTIDTMVGAGAPGASWGWMVEGGGHGGGGGMAGGMGTLGSVLGNPMAGKSITDDPSYQFRFGEGMKALERSAASKGTLLTGGTLKALTRYGQDYASTEYQNAYSRAASEQGNNFNRLFSVSGMGLDATGAAAQNASGYARTAGDMMLQRGNAQAQGTIAQGNANAGMVNTLGNLAGQYYAGRQVQGQQPSWIDHGRGLY